MGDSVAAPDASLSAAAAKRNARGAQNGSNKSEVTAAASDPSGITDIYRGIMHSAGREAPGRWERINKARAQARLGNQNGGPSAATDSQPTDSSEGDEDEAVDDTEEPEVTVVELISAPGDVSVGDLIEVRDKPAGSAWYDAKVLAVSRKGVKV